MDSLSVLIAAAGISAGAASPVYVKEDTWTDTVVATRANLARHREEAGPRTKGSDAKPYSTGSIRGDGPGKQVSVKVTGRRWLRLVGVLESGGGNCHIWGDAKLIAKDGTEVRLSGLDPVDVNVGWGELLRNKNWQNHPLRIGKRQFEHGIWVHAKSDIAYDLDGKYDRFEAWVGMDADRAKGVSRFSVSFGRADPFPGVCRKLKADFPEQAKWLVQDAGRRRQFEWIAERDITKRVAGMVGRAVGQLGTSGKELRKQLAEVRRAKADEGRWLDLYSRACRYRACRTLLDRAPLAELRSTLDSWFVELLEADVSPDDPRWTQRYAALKEMVEGLPDGRCVELAHLGDSVAALSRTLPGRFAASDQLLARLAECERRWARLSAGLGRGENAAVERIPPLVRDVRSLARDVLLSLAGMREFLAQPCNAGMAAEWDSQFAVLKHDLGNRARFTRVAEETFHAEALIHDSDRDPVDVVLRRTAALFADLRCTAAGPKLAELEAHLARLRAANEGIDVEAAEARFALFADACRTRRRIAFSNPLLTFDRILLLKRHRSTFNHMCDQYYGADAVPGGGLFVLSDPFGPEPKVREVMADSVVERGRLEDAKLDGGSFLSPDLSYDAQSIVFAYTECQGDRGHEHHTDPSRGHWDRGRSYHVFKVNVDGTGLEQLTDGTWNDFDPCWMPSGRIAFISERRGGYLRCGRVCPTYTLFDMAADGSDIRCLSIHETNEWHPSVTHSGRIVWTRWDYVDRHGCVAHMPWITSPDGCDPRPVHGNYAPRRRRADMELDVRAIPGSPKYIATAAPHHGQAFGSLVLVDPRVEDDDGMAPVRRITAEVAFPESQGGREVYGSPWPLSEKYYLCVYDAEKALGQRGGRGKYGIYLVDCFGNRELIYRDPEIACHSPVPLRPRPRPPVVQGTFESARSGRGEAVVGVVSVYQSSRTWPEGTKIRALRIVQILPLSVASAATAHNIGIQIPQGSDSINLARAVLGTVPVEADGSAHFVVPAQKELYFQALDERGLAITTMRSGTHFQPGERTMCQGCHEPRHGAPPSPPRFTLAMRRAPSAIKPHVDGTKPFSYPRLVQPVLDRHCVACHVKHPGKAPRLGRELAKYPARGRGMNKVTTYFTSYASLAPKHGFYDYGGRGWDDPKWYRTTPGEFGARASKLYPMLLKGHHDLKLPPEDLHRIAIWLDLCSPFYGVYEKEGGLAQLRGEIARPTLE